ncbi:MAG: ABC transporter ATP-binding protein [bacterium]|nr:ABC transporter ATP-binding protein [Acidimicrobiia bacterium]MCY4650014.1 ABC transporter ATP-binding protein [bacterium]
MNHPGVGTGIVLDSVGVTFGGDNPVVALEEVSLEIPAGEFLAIVGPSGCGKSTLLRVVCGLLKPTVGTVSVHGKTPEQARRDVEFGFVFQNPVLFPWLRALDNVLLPDKILGERSPTHGPLTENLARRLMRDVGLAGFEEHYPAQMSGGMQSRVALARVLIYEASTLLMDEPFGALDEFTRDRLNMQLLDVWAKAQTTVLFVTHSIQEAIFLADRVVVLSPRPGRIARVATVPFKRPRPLELRYEPAFGSLASQLRSLLETDGES